VGVGEICLGCLGFGSGGGGGAYGALTLLLRLLVGFLALACCAFSALARACCSACVRTAVHTLSLINFHKASCSSALANSFIRIVALPHVFMFMISDNSVICHLQVLKKYSNTSLLVVEKNSTINTNEIAKLTNSKSITILNESTHAEIEERDLYALIKSALRISLVISDKTEITIIKVDENAYLEKSSNSNIKIIRCFKFGEEELNFIQRLTGLLEKLFALKLRISELNELSDKNYALMLELQKELEDINETSKRFGRKQISASIKDLRRMLKSNW
jgi:hypothetical protein